MNLKLRPYFSEMGARHGASLARLFSAGVIKDLATRGHSALATQVLRESGADRLISPSLSLGDFFDILFAVLFKSYRNEYIYKNAIANKILLGRHSLNSSFMLTEFRVLNRKADCVVINGTSNAYEIKSEFDSMVRLRRQVDAYRKVFDRVHVITSLDQLDCVTSEVGDGIGVMVLNNRNGISTVREARSLKAHAVPAAIFDSLRRPEYLKIIRNHFGSEPEVPNTLIHQACKSLFCKLSSTVVHDGMVQVLKERGRCNSLRHFIKDAPFSLKAASIACKLTGREQAFFTSLLRSSAKDCLLTPLTA